MLDLMRKHAKSWVINVLIAAIAIVFIFWGAGSFRKQEATKVATVNGEPISVAEFQETYRQLLEMAQNQYKDFLNDELLQLLNLKNQAMDRLINEHIIAQQAGALGVSITNDAIQRNIAETPLFLVDGKFNAKRYQSMLARFGYAPAQYEEMVRKDLVNREVIRLIGSMAKVSENEAKDFFHMINDKVDLDFVKFPPEAFRDKASFTPEEVDKYYENNKEKYRMPAKVKVSYLAFRPSDFEGDVVVGEDAMADYYELSLDSYREPEKVKARHILFKLDSNATPEELAKVRSKAEAVLAKAKAEGADFAALAMENSEGPSAPQGGDLGWFARNEMVDQFSDVAFKMKKGEISDLVRTDFGLHIILLEDRKAATSRTFEEVKDEIRTKLAKERAAEAAAEKAETVYEEISLTQDFKAAAEKLNLEPKETGFFSQEEIQTNASADPKFNQFAVALKKGENSPLLDLSDGHYLINCLERAESYLPELKEVRAQVEEDLTMEKAGELANEAAKAFIKEVGEKKDWDKAVEALQLPDTTVKTDKVDEPGDTGETSEAGEAKEGENAGEAVETMGIESGSTGAFSRYESIPNIGSNQAIINKVFIIKSVGDVAPEPFKTDLGYYVFRLGEKLPALDDDFQKQKENLMKRIQQGKAQTLVQKWLDSVKQKSEIVLEEGVI